MSIGAIDLAKFLTQIATLTEVEQIFTLLAVEAADVKKYHTSNFCLAQLSQDVKDKLVEHMKAVCTGGTTHGLN